MKISKLLSILILFISTNSFGQGILSGTISYKYLSGTKYQFTVELYTTPSAPGSHDSISLNFGDGTVEKVATSSNPAQLGIQNWVYAFTHTYNSSGQYVVSITEGFRVAGIKNITNSASQEMQLEASVIVSPGQGANNSPVINNPPLVNGSSGAPYFHNPGAFDSEGDSLAYTLLAPSGNGTIPTGASIDQLTGNFQMPYNPGPYVVTVQIEEFRSGMKIGSTTQDLLVDDGGVIGLDNYNLDPSKLQVYPNPCADMLNMELENGLKNIKISSLEGKIVFDSKQGESKFKKIDISQFPAGVYLLEMTDQKGIRYTEKIIKK